MMITMLEKCVGEYIRKTGHKNVGYIGVYRADEAVGIRRRQEFWTDLRHLEFMITLIKKVITGFLRRTEKCERRCGENEADAIVCATDRLAFWSL